jgi:hypothetical protein
LWVGDCGGVGGGLGGEARGEDAWLRWWGRP